MSYIQQIMAPVQAFALVAGLSGCGSKLASINTPEPKMAQTVHETLPPMPKKNTSKADFFFADLHEDEGFEDPFIDTSFFSRKVEAMVRNCALLPKNDLSYGTQDWELDCSMRFTEAGLELINQVLDIRARKRMGQYLSLRL